MPQPKLLLVDDDAAFRRVYKRVLEEMGFEIVEADSRPAAVACLDASVDLVLLDLMLPPDGSVQTGLDHLAKINHDFPRTKVIVVSGAGDEQYMVSAVRSGAFDFLTKPVDPDVLQVVVERAQQRVMLEKHVNQLQRSLEHRDTGFSLVGQSAPFLAAVELAERVAKADLPILVTGENGTGKEQIARHIHNCSARRSGPFVPVNCGALSENLLESTLFGHVRGAFTGAVRDHKGLFRQAEGGTLFLDEIGDMPSALQVKLLRVLENGEILSVGAERADAVDVRIVSATNRDLAALQQSGEFREDLYWRINGAEVKLPPLRERRDDIPLLAKFFLNRCAHLTSDGRAKILSDAATEALIDRAFPGNLRQLRHEMQRATVLAGDREAIEPEDMSASPSANKLTASEASAPVDGTLAQQVAALERQAIAAALAEHDGNRTHAAKALGLSRQGLIGKIERYGL